MENNKEQICPNPGHHRLVQQQCGAFGPTFFGIKFKLQLHIFSEMYGGGVYTHHCISYLLVVIVFFCIKDMFFCAFANSTEDLPKFHSPGTVNILKGRLLHSCKGVLHTPM